MFQMQCPFEFQRLHLQSSTLLLQPGKQQVPSTLAADTQVAPSWKWGLPGLVCAALLVEIFGEYAVVGDLSLSLSLPLGLKKNKVK